VRTTISRIRRGLGIGERSALIIAAAALAAVGASVALSTQMNLLVQATGILVALFALLVSLRWPLVPLFVLAILIPIEEVLVVGGLGTVSRFAELLFIVAYGLPRLGRLTLSAMPLAGWAYVGWAALSVGWAIDPSVVLNELPTLLLLFGTAVLVACAVAERPRIVRPVLWAYSLSAAVTAVIGISEYIQGGHLAVARVAALPGQDPAHYAALLMPALVFSLYELLHGRLVVVAAAVATVCTVGVILSGARGAWLSAAVVAAFYLVPRLAPARRLVAVAVLVGLVALALQLPGVAAFVGSRTDTALSSGGAGRTDIWSVGLLIYESSPVTGVGLANFPLAFTTGRMREADVMIAAWRPANRAPHSIVIGTLGELGTVGLVLLALFLIPLLVRKGWGPDAVAVQAALASLATMALFLDVLNRKQVWLVLGIACGLAYLARRSPRATPAEEHPRASQPGLAGGLLSGDALAEVVTPAAPGVSMTT
jgi:exopolysaccharide production protein ExoQ